MYHLLVLAVCRNLPVSSVLPEERFLLRPLTHAPGFYRAVARYGYGACPYLRIHITSLASRAILKRGKVARVAQLSSKGSTHRLILCQRMTGKHMIGSRQYTGYRASIQRS
jgi:hypothetical protein